MLKSTYFVGVLLCANIVGVLLCAKQYAMICKGTKLNFNSFWQELIVHFCCAVY